MRLIKPVAATIAAFALAAGGVIVAAGTANATYSDCLDFAVVNDALPRENIVNDACRDGAKGETAKCVESFMVKSASGNGWGRYGPGFSKDLADQACKKAAVQPTP